MKNDSNVRLNFLDKANGATSILAILAAVAAFPGGLRIYQFMMDASDSKIEPVNLTGLGDMTIPGLGYVLKEPYASLVLYALAVIIPVWILISLLVKKRGLGKHKLVGRGLYWLIILLGIGGILGGLGILPKLVSNNLGNPFNIDTDPANLAFVGGSILAIITAWFALHFLGQAKKAPGVDQFHEDDTLVDTVEDRRSGRYVQNDGISERDFTPSVDAPVDPAHQEITLSPQAVAPDESLKRTFSGDTVIIDPVSPAAMPVDSGANVLTGSLATASGAVSADAMTRDEALIPTEESTDPPVRLDEETTAAYAADGLRDVEKPVLRRKLIAFPGDDTKVIVVMREYAQDELIREWAEIHPKSEFTRKS